MVVGLELGRRDEAHVGGVGLGEQHGDLVDKYLLAVSERNVRLLYLRPYTTTELEPYLLVKVPSLFIYNIFIYNLLDLNQDFKA